MTSFATFQAQVKNIRCQLKNLLVGGGTCNLQNYFRDTWPKRVRRALSLLASRCFDVIPGRRSGVFQWAGSLWGYSLGISDLTRTKLRLDSPPPTCAAPPTLPLPVNGSCSLLITRPQAVWLSSFPHTSCPEVSKSCISAFKIHVAYNYFLSVLLPSPGPGQGLAGLTHEGPDNKYLRLCRPYNLCDSFSTLPLSQKQP